MGQTLSEPVTEKHSDSGIDERYAYAVSEMQGWRVSMEDAHTTLLKLDEESGNALFAVFDGHGGSSIARFSGTHLAKRLASEEAYRSRKYEEALKKAFLGTDEDLRADPAFFHDPSGCTAVAALITGDRKLYVANAGDSRSVLSCAGLAKPMSYDHKPTNEKETQRIVAAGGYVEYGRVNGNLALSRAIGDFEFKNNHTLQAEKQIVTVDPDIIEHDLTDEDEFLILACDGIWDCLSSQQAIDTVRRLAAQRKSLVEICETTIQRCCAPDADTGAGIGCDNMTMIVLAVLNGKTLDQWYDWMAERVQGQVGHATPEELPQVFAESRILAAQQRAAFRNSNNGGGIGGAGFGGPGFSLRGPAGFGALARVLGGGGISFHQAGGKDPSGHTLVTFDGDDDDVYDYDDDEDEDVGDTGEGGLFGVNRLKVAGGSGNGKDVTESLRDQLDDLEEGIGEDEQEDAKNRKAGEGSSKKDHDGDHEMKDDFVAPVKKADITLPSPSERQGIIDLDSLSAASTSDTTSSSFTKSSNDSSSTEQPQSLKPFAKLSSPAIGPNTSATGSPLVPTHSALADFGRKASDEDKVVGEVNGRIETPPPPTPNVDDEKKVPEQATQRVPDADATTKKGSGPANELLDKSEDPVKA